MMPNLNVDFILSLYEKYIYELKKVREYQRKLLSSQKNHSQSKEHFNYILDNNTGKIKIAPKLEDIEAEMTYLLIREFKPETIVEISPYKGWSTSWILNAIKDNGAGKLYSYDLIDDSTKMIPLDLSKGRWTFIRGDIKKNMDKLPQKIDYLFIDSEHSADFAREYIKNIFPKLENGTPISIHDVFAEEYHAIFNSERNVILDWLKEKKINYFTVSSIREKIVYNKIMSAKKKLNIKRPIVRSRTNSMIFFYFLKDKIT